MPPNMSLSIRRLSVPVERSGLSWWQDWACAEALSNSSSKGAATFSLHSVWSVD
jgi:hypothetical protein